MWNTGAWEFLPVLIFALTALPLKNAKICTTRKISRYIITIANICMQSNRMGNDRHCVVANIKRMSKPISINGCWNSVAIRRRFSGVSQFSGIDLLPRHSEIHLGLFKLMLWQRYVAWPCSCYQRRWRRNMCTQNSTLKEAVALTLTFQWCSNIPPFPQGEKRGVW